MIQQIGFPWHNPSPMIESRISLIHATPLAMQPVAEAFKRLWPQARCRNLLDDSLTGDLQEAGGLTPGLIQRMVGLVDYVHAHGAQGVLFTCSAFGPAIDAAKRAHAIPVLKPNEAMYDEALALCKAMGGLRRIGLITTFAPASVSMAHELQEAIAAWHLPVSVESRCADGALEHLNAGDVARHDHLVIDAAQKMPACDVYLLGQFSMAGVQDALADVLQKPVLTSPSSAVAALKTALTPGR